MGGPTKKTVSRRKQIEKARIVLAKKRQTSQVNKQSSSSTPCEGHKPSTSRECETSASKRLKFLQSEERKTVN